jgi:chorismate mutase
MEREKMEQSTGYFVVKQKALPEVLLKVVEAKRLIESERAVSVQEATERVGISRSSFYKYKDDIFPFHDTAAGRTITLTFQMDDEPGLLSDVLKIIATFGAYINHPSEYSDQRSCLPDDQCTGIADNGGCIPDGR